MVSLTDSAKETSKRPKIREHGPNTCSKTLSFDAGRGKTVYKCDYSYLGRAHKHEFFSRICRRSNINIGRAIAQPSLRRALRDRGGTHVTMKCVAKTVSGATAEFECEPTDTLAEIKVLCAQMRTHSRGARASLGTDGWRGRRRERSGVGLRGALDAGILRG